MVGMQSSLHRLRDFVARRLDSDRMPELSMQHTAREVKSLLRYLQPALARVSRVASDVAKNLLCVPMSSDWQRLAN
eukprot:6104027-Amphidinium_carterae.1